MSTPGKVVFESDDLDRTEEFLCDSYAPMRIGSGSRDSGARITRVATDAVSADELDLDFDMSYDVNPLGRICLCDIAAGTIEDHRVAGWTEPADFAPGDLFSFAPPDRPYSGRICRARYSITMLDPELLTRVAGVEKPVELLDHNPVSAAAAQHLRAAITFLREQVLSAPDIAEHPLLVSTATQHLAAAVLTAFPTTALDERAGTDLDAHPQALRRAIAFVEANPARDLTATDLALAAGVSARAVQLAFRRHLDTTPMAYLRRVRLDHARAELRAATPGETTVTQVAARWGYTRPSAFTAHYRAAYGELPSRALHD
ncbi:AraC family transcriptional regulator [Amycolatopsis sp. AA4]|uniref:helix-turn-helix transcriptional regulator n=1 Tax=Actinomycetes TaxID=1760 RepID=UPI0001B55A05|nr:MULTISPECIES: helix-turn-helix transcriptional regulator [Actinomycetes]ATY09107.1 AraC family transcriptional regulator [Amycolatopsis sp. AA4]